MNHKHSANSDNAHKQMLQRQAIAYHEAGHAAAIYLNNKAHNLPHIDFNIILSDTESSIEEMEGSFQSTHNKCSSRVEGGRLVQLFVPNIADLSSDFLSQVGLISTSKEDYLSAFDADIMNLLVGPLAEAKFSYRRDDELFTHKMINIEALKKLWWSS